MGKKLGIEKVHPHKFRRTMAARAIEKGMPIESRCRKFLDMSRLIPRSDIMVKQNNLKLSHRKYKS